MANRIKIEVRDEPVFPRDFALLKEVGSAVGNYDIHYPVSAIAVIAGLSLVLVVLGLFVGCQSLPGARSCGAGWGSLLGTAASFAVLAGLILTVYASNDLYNSFRVSNAYYIPSVFNELGFPYCFCHQFTTYPVDKPEGFDRAEAASWDRGGQTGLGEDVNVIMVMNEAFSDITEDDAFAYTAGERPPAKSPRPASRIPTPSPATSWCPGFAGGTANTEFDVLTGMQTNALSADNHLLFPGGEPESWTACSGSVRGRRLPHLLLPPRGRLVLQPGERLPLVRGGEDGVRRPDGGPGSTRAAGSLTTIWPA